MTNREAYLAYLNGLNEYLPEPRTREEALLYRLCLNGGGGGSSLAISDASYLFYNNSRLDVIDELISVLKDVKLAKQMFQNCTQLKNAPTLDWSSIENANYMFDGCSNMVGEIDLSGSKLKNFQSIFSGCKKLEGILNFGFSAAGTYGLGGSFPKGTSSSPAALKRFTFAPDNAYTAISGLDFSYCSFEREGAVEMFESLKTLTANPGGTYNQITLTGNPCVTGEAVLAEGNYVLVNNYEEACALFDGVPADTEIAMAFNNDSIRSYSALEEALILLERETFPMMISWQETRYAVDTLTEEDKAIATNKGWVLVEA